MRPSVGWNQARRRRQLPEHQDVARRLDDLQHVVVGRRQHGRAFVRPDDASLLQRTVLVAVEASDRFVGSRASLPLWRHWRNPPVRRIVDERGSVARQRFEVRGREPERVVVVRRIVLHDAFTPLLVAGAEDARGERIDIVLGQERRQFRRFLVRQKLLAGVSRGPRERCERVRRPDALQIRMAVRRTCAAFPCVSPRLWRLSAHRYGRHNHTCGHDDAFSWDASLAHVSLPRGSRRDFVPAIIAGMTSKRSPTIP